MPSASPYYPDSLGEIRSFSFFVLSPIVSVTIFTNLCSDFLLPSSSHHFKGTDYDNINILMLFIFLFLVLKRAPGT